MILKEIYLYPELTEFSIEITSKFRYETRSLCVFLERGLKGRKINTNDYKKICFLGRKHAGNGCFVNSSNVLTIDFEIEIDEYLSLGNEGISKNEYFIKLLQRGFGIAQARPELSDVIPILFDAIENFRKANYKNVWSFSKKKWAPLKLEWEIFCDLSLEKFSLFIEVRKNGEMVHEEKILDTKPDEVFFSPVLKTIRESGGKIFVDYDLGKSTYCLDLKKIGNRS